MSKRTDLSTPPAFTTIDPAALEAVTGGTTTKVSEDQILDKLVSITSAVGELAASWAKPKNDGMASMMPMLMMMMMKKNGPL